MVRSPASGLAGAFSLAALWVPLWDMALPAPRGWQDLSGFPAKIDDFDGFLRKFLQEFPAVSAVQTGQNWP